MAERIDPFHEGERLSDQDAGIDNATHQVKADIEQLIEGLDLPSIINRIDAFGRSNPVGIAITALSLGVAVGILMKNTSKKGSMPFHLHRG